jgi:hypothetical protein
MNLQSEDREFFAAVAAIIYSNPFDDARDEIRALVPGTGALADGTLDHPFGAVAPALDERLARLAAAGVQRLGDVAARDRELLQTAFLFQLYHRHVDHFDALIDAQLEAGDEPAPMAFAGELQGELDARGFSAGDADRFIALFFQLRRAYYFILGSLVGDSDCMRRFRHGLWNNVFTADIRLYAEHLWDRMEDFSTLVLGETGTGKGSAAAAIGHSGFIPFHRKQGRFKLSFTKTFIATNLSQFPESLMESELFGHRKGAFTGAIDNHRGLFERTSAHGSLFLDEIGEVSTPNQIKLLNVLQERQFSPVGSHELLRFEGRVIAATNRTLDELRASATFREDFLYRLCSDVIQVPPLRQRLRESPDELAQLVSLLVKRTTGNADAGLTEMIVTSLGTCLPRDYAWPGNVRELEQAVRRILLNGHYEPARPVGAEDDGNGLDAAIGAGELTASELLSRYCRVLYARLGSYEGVAKLTALDRRTVKKYIDQPG